MLARRPLVWLAAALLIGTVAGEFWPHSIAPAVAPFGAALLLVLALVLQGRRLRAREKEQAGEAPADAGPLPDVAAARLDPLPFKNVHPPARRAGDPGEYRAAASPFLPGQASPLAAKAGATWLRQRELWLLAAGLMVMAAGAWRARTVADGMRRGFEALPAYADVEASFLAPAEEAVLSGEPGAWRAPVLLTAIDGQPLDPPLAVLAAGRGRRDFRRGDRLRGRVRKEYTPGAAFPTAFDARQWLAGNGLAGRVRMVRPPPWLRPAPNTDARADAESGTDVDKKNILGHDPGNVTGNIPGDLANGETAVGGKNAVAADPYVIEPVEGFLPRRRLDAWRTEALRRMFGEFDGEEAGLLAAMIYGFRRELDADLRDAFRRVGIGHVLAISGLHVGLIIWLAWTVLGWFVHDRRARAGVCILLCLLYLGVAGARVAAERATVMTVIHLAGYLIGRRSDMANSLGAAAMLLVWSNPATVFDLGFQLSFVAVLFISRCDLEARPWYGVLAGLRRGEPGKPARWRRPLATVRPGEGGESPALRWARRRYAAGWMLRRGIYWLAGLVVLSLAAGSATRRWWRGTSDRSTSPGFGSTWRSFR